MAQRFIDIEGAKFLVSKDLERAKIDSPEFTGVPKAPTPAAGTKDTQIATTEFVADAITKAVDSAYTLKGAVPGLDDLPQPPDVKPGDIYTVNEDIVETADGQEKKLTGTVPTYADLPANAPDGAVYKVEQAYTDPVSGTAYDPDSFWLASNTGGTATWSNLTGAKLYPAGADWKYTDKDGYVPMDNPLDLSAYETEAIPVSELAALYNV